MSLLHFVICVASHHTLSKFKIEDRKENQKKIKKRNRKKIKKKNKIEPSLLFTTLTIGSTSCSNTLYPMSSVFFS